MKNNGEFTDTWKEQNSLNIAIYVIALRRLLASCDKVRPSGAGRVVYVVQSERVFS